MQNKLQEILNNPEYAPEVEGGYSQDQVIEAYELAKSEDAERIKELEEKLADIKECIELKDLGQLRPSITRIIDRRKYSGIY